MQLRLNQSQGALAYFTALITSLAVALVVSGCDSDRNGNANGASAKQGAQSSERFRAQMAAEASAQPSNASRSSTAGADNKPVAAPEIRGTLLSSMGLSSSGTASGRSVSSTKDYRGKFLIVNFWATWCGPCVAELPALERMYQQLKTKFPDGRFELIGLNADIDSSIDAVKEMVHSRGLTFPIVLDPEGAVVKDFDLTGFPETFFIDPGGNFIHPVDPDSGNSGDRIISDRPWDTEPYIKLVADMISSASQPR